MIQATVKCAKGGPDSIVVTIPKNVLKSSEISEGQIPSILQTERAGFISVQKEKDKVTQSERDDDGIENFT